MQKIIPNLQKKSSTKMKPKSFKIS
jgi:hypothetical protein